MSQECLILADLFQILLGQYRYTATKPKLLVKGTCTIFTELLNRKKKSCAITEHAD